jgi:hypothetical protein
MAVWQPLAPVRIRDGTGQKITATGSNQTLTAIASADITSGAVNKGQAMLVILQATTAPVRVAFNQAATAAALLIQPSVNMYLLRANAGDVINVLQDSAGGVLSVIEASY